jgi:hypothetical protein
MNHLNVSLQHFITTLAGKGWSARKIARELSINRETVGKYLRQKTASSNPAIPPAGSAGESDPKPALVPTGSGPGRRSQCEPWREVIEQGLLAGLSAQRLFQDLVAAHCLHRRIRCGQTFRAPVGREDRTALPPHGV